MRDFLDKLDDVLLIVTIGLLGGFLLTLAALLQFGRPL